MPVLDHTIVASHDHRHAAEFVADVLGLPAPITVGHFQVVSIGTLTTLDFAHVDGPIRSQHYAFLVTEAEFDQIFSRIIDRHVPYWADPAHRQPGEINTWDGGRGVYFDDPSGLRSRSSPAPTAAEAAPFDPHPLLTETPPA